MHRTQSTDFVLGGNYLATEFLSELVGLEEYAICHVRGHSTSSFRLSNEGDPVALGVNDVWLGAIFIHTKAPGDVLRHYVDGQQTVILVDSIVNSGKTAVEFAQHISALHLTVRIVVITAVIISLRLSDNNFVGRGTTDMGNRFFNTAKKFL
ncbi:uracil phosphoribosyltransferase-domain-containing protein [Xylariaceae sp. FL1651]|nr:uracil phosphoribosyltransferase-domain-containing protein [Xylariaceae sp. FL1651]